MFTTLYYEDYAIGQERSTCGRTITEADIVLHAGQTGDFYPHHMDEEWCKTQSFQRRIAHGTLIFSVAVGMSAGTINPEAMSYGYDRLRFIKPVFIGDTITVKLRWSEKKDHPRKSEYGIVTEALEVLNQKKETVLVCDHLLLVKRIKPTPHGV
jgi:acyl dehydratase